MKAPRIHDPAPRAPLADGIASSARHLVMLELLNTDGHRNYRSQHYPFLKALLPERGVQAEWLSLGVPVNEIRAGSPLYVYDLGEAERRCVIERLRALAPTHILLNERLEEGLWRALREALPAARFLLCDSETSLGAALSVGEWLHLDTRALEEAGVALEDFVIPDFRREPINFLASQIRPPIHLSLGAQCVFRKSIAHNPHFRELDLSESARSRGCSFCFSGGPELVLPKTPTLELAMRQIEAAERSATPAMFGRKYLVHGVELWFRIDAFVEALERQKIPPSSFEFSVRLDEVLGVRERLERALLRAQELGHTLGLMNTSVENFSAQENERFNKGIEPQTIDRALTLIYELEARFPQTLLFSELGGFGAILYTPWTTLEDLRINARAFRKFGVEASSFVFDSALQLVEGLPITRLAEADGLIVDAFEDYRYDSGCINDWQLRDIPWRFEHAEVAMAYALGRRLSRMATIPPNEPRYALVQAWLNGLEPAGVSVLDVFDALLEEMQARPEERSFMAIMKGIEVRLGQRSALDLQAIEEADLETAAAELTVDREGLPTLWTALGAQVQRCFEQRPEARRALRGAEFEAVRLKRYSDHFGLEIDLRRGGERLRLFVEQTRAERRAYLRRGSFALSYSGAPSPADEVAMRAVLKIVEKLASLGAWEAPGGPAPRKSEAQAR